MTQSVSEDSPDGPAYTPGNQDVRFTVPVGLPRIVGHVSLALALSAYETWLEQGDTNLLDLIDQGLSLLEGYLRS